jgi:serine/threonine protein kinase
MDRERLAEVWPGWQIEELIGEGAFGKVYKAVREEYGIISTAAIKVISIPQSEQEVRVLSTEGYDEATSRTYFEGIVQDFVSEIRLMESMKGSTNIVSVEDFQVLERKEGIGWDILIRMELLTPFDEWAKGRALTEREIVKLGTDICAALELCAQKSIIHRDIKPENIFVSSFGDFKLGDFGIARELEKTRGNLSSKGTQNYIAPEVAASRSYDARVDIYSLGVVLYRLANNNRLPFIDPKAATIRYQEREDAVARRLAGEPLPAPLNASSVLADAILAACAFEPSRRFSTPTALKVALASTQEASPRPARAPIAAASSAPAPAASADAPTDLDSTKAARLAPERPDQAASAPPDARDTPSEEASKKPASAKRRKSRKGLVVGIAFVLAILLAGGGFFAYRFLYEPEGAKVEQDAPPVEEPVIETVEILFDANYPETGEDSSSAEPQKREFVTGEAYGTLPQPSKDGYRFLGWYASRSGGQQITATSAVSLGDGATLYALMASCITRGSATIRSPSATRRSCIGWICPRTTTSCCPVSMLGRRT